MLKTANRLKKKSDFAATLAMGERVKYGPLLFFTQTTTDPIRIGIVVSKKVDKKAVVRNHLRRLLSHEFAAAIREKEATGDVVVVVLFTNPNIKDQIIKAVNQWAEKL